MSSMLINKSFKKSQNRSRKFYITGRVAYIPVIEMGKGYLPVLGSLYPSLNNFTALL